MAAAINANTLAVANDRGRGGGGGVVLNVVNNGEPVTATQEDNGIDAKGRREITLMLNRIVDERVPSALGKKASRDVLAQQYGVTRKTGGGR